MVFLGSFPCFFYIFLIQTWRESSWDTITLFVISFILLSEMVNAFVQQLLLLHFLYIFFYIYTTKLFYNQTIFLSFSLAHMHKRLQRGHKRTWIFLGDFFCIWFFWIFLGDFLEGLDSRRSFTAMSDTSKARSLEETPTWAVAVVCFVMIVISILIEHVIHMIEKVCALDCISISSNG